jgi:Zn-dependent peptidase ImmA (M78 family)/DNA-binding XRE family transcriptional regulator
VAVEEARLKEAREVRRLFDGERLRIAREVQGRTQQSVAEACKISSAAIGQFEKGVATPNSRTLLNLSDVLRFPVAFFRDDVADSQLDTPAFFRSLRSASVRDQKRARAFVELVREFTLALESKVEFPVNAIPRHPRDPDNESGPPIEEIAARVRDEWDIAHDEPVDNVVRRVERAGAIVIRTEFDVEKIDAFSVAYEDRPVVVLCSDKGLYDRSRFDGAHELGHLVMHEPDDCGKKSAEKQANEFAAAFLMPENGIIDELPHKADWAEFVALKRRWGVSIAALLFRAKTLEVMSPESYLRAVKTMSARGWRTKEPEPLGPAESPQLLRKAVEALEEDGYTTDDLAELASIPIDQVRRILQATAPTKRRIKL